MNQVIERAAKKNPLIQYLPEFTSDYNIDYDINPDTGIVSYFIESNETEPDTDPNILPVGVRDFIKSKGIDPDTIKFEWREKSL